MVEELGSTYGLARHGGGGALIAVEVVILEIRILAAGSSSRELKSCIRVE